MESETRDAIVRWELKSNRFTEAIKILKSQYRHPSSVVKASLKRVTVRPRMEKGDTSTFIMLRNNLRACLEVLKENENDEYEINVSANVERVIDRLRWICR